jgi:hypothetical protein
MSQSLREIASEAGLSHVGVSKRIKRGLSWNQATKEWVKAQPAPEVPVGPSNGIKKVEIPAVQTLEQTRERVRGWARTHPGQRPGLNEIGIS